MLRDGMRAVANWCVAMCVAVLLFGSTKVVAQTLAECEDLSRRASDQQALEHADFDAWQRAEDRLTSLHTTMKGYAARLQGNPQDMDQSIRGILGALSQMRQVRADIKAASDRWERDDQVLVQLERQMGDCYSRLPQQGSAPGSFQVTLTAGDRTETVELTVANGRWNIVNRWRQGIKLPSRDPNASDTTSRVTVANKVTARVEAPHLPAGWVLWLGVGMINRTPGEQLCSAANGQSCTASSGPYPGVRRGYGRGWAAGESAEVWLCKEGEDCYGKMDPVAAININWVLP